ncbi:ladderlectin-like, partial [Clarias magur]
AAIETEPEQDQKIPGETTKLAVEEVIEAAEDKVGDLKLDDDAEDKYNYCPSGWVKYGSRCFRLMRSIQYWLNAEAQCVAQQARLASVHNLGEYNFLQSLLDMAGVTSAWIGAYYFQGAWLWVDTDRFQYTNWYSLIDPFSCPCAYMRNNVPLIPYGQSIPSTAAVETKPEQEQKLPGEATELAEEEVIKAAEDKVEALKLDADAEDKYNYCPSGWVKYGSRCFRLMRTTQTWLNAEAQCVAQKAKLASVHNLGEYNFLQSLLDMAGVAYAWIGAYNFQLQQLRLNLSGNRDFQAECVAQKSRLASVHNIMEYNFLQSLLDIAGVTQAWIGAYHFQGTWLWFDTSELSYTNWQSLSTVSNYTCAYMKKN